MRLLANPEVLRRLALAASLFISIIFFMNPHDHVLRVHLVNFERMQKHSFTLPPSIKKLPLDKFIAHETKGRLKMVSTPEWNKVLQNLLKSRDGQTPEEWRDNRSGSYLRKDSDFYFAPDQEPFASEVGKDGEVRYIALGQNRVRHYMKLAVEKPRHARDAPSAVMYPLRSYAWLPLIIGLIVYFFLPKVKKPTNSLGYGKLWGLVFSDLIGLVFAGFFFWLPIGLLIEKAGSFLAIFDFETGRLGLVLCVWLLSGLCLGFMWIGVWYRNFWITITPKGLLRHTYNGERLFSYRGMKRVSLAQKKYHWLIALLLLVGGGRSTAIGQAEMLVGQKHFGINIDMNNKTNWWIRLEAFQNPELLLKVLRDNGVLLDEYLRKSINVFSPGHAN